MGTSIVGRCVDVDVAVSAGFTEMRSSGNVCRSCGGMAGSFVSPRSARTHAGAAMSGHARHATSQTQFERNKFRLDRVCEAALMIVVRSDDSLLPDAGFEGSAERDDLFF